MGLVCCGVPGFLSSDSMKEAAQSTELSAKPID